MNLFLNAVSETGMFILFDNDRQIVNSREVAIGGQESMKFIDLVDRFMSDNNLVYNNVDNVIVVNGPGSFTGIRTICLAVNTLNYIIKKNLTDMSFFDLYNKYPIIKPSSKRDLFVKMNKTSKIEIITNDDFHLYCKENDIKKIYGNSGNIVFDESISILPEIDYKSFIRDTRLNDKKMIEALYIKKPNIS